MNPSFVPFINTFSELMELVTCGYKGHVKVPKEVSSQLKDITAKQNDEKLIDMSDEEKNELKDKNMWIGDLKTKPIPCQLCVYLLSL